MTFIEAIAYMLSRDVVLPDEYYGRMTERQRKRAFSVAGLASLEQIKHIANELNKVLESGETFETFQKRIRSGDINVNLPKHRWDNIFRTNIQASYGQGRWQQQQANKEFRPYLMYDAVNDSRTRPSHSQLDGTIRHIDDPIWERIYPPIGYRCRCIVRALTEEQVEAQGGESDVSNIQLDNSDWGSPRTYDSVLADKIDAWGANVNVSPSNFAAIQDAKARIQSMIELEATAIRLKHVISDGKRNELPLTQVQVSQIQKVIDEYDIDSASVVFSDNMNTGYKYLFGTEMLYIGTDVLPTDNPDKHKSANSNLSMPATIAHELSGHRDAERANKSHPDPLLEEVQASMRASLFGLLLTDGDRELLKQDAIDRLGKEGLLLDNIIDDLWLDPYE